MRCPRCGNENSEGNRFCGMCGATLTAPAGPATVMPAAARGEKHTESAAGRPSGERGSSEPGFSPRSARVEPPEPTITGPSFLGLNKPRDGRRSRDSYGQSSSSVDYLLEDDEEPKRGWGKLVLVLFALVLAGGFGYLHWRQGGFDWVMNGKKAAPAADGSQSAPPAVAPSSSSPPDSAPNPTATTNPANASPSNQAPSNDGTATGAPAAPGSNASTTPANPEPATPVATNLGQAPPTETAATANSGKPSTDKSGETVDADAAASGDSESEVTAKPSASTKPLRKPTPVTPVDTTAEAERYVYGRGVRQDCERGLRLLKSATAQSNPKAMVTMGTLYSTGTCTPRDLPTAYRWFAMALHKQPDNQALQDDLQKLWGQMTQPERQLAIKLSQ